MMQSQRRKSAGMTKAAAKAQLRLIPSDDGLDAQVNELMELIQTTPPNSPSVVMDLSPELCRWVLDNLNTHNRKPRHAKIKVMRGNAVNGRFMLTGDTIKFGTNGILLDGQNRLNAIMRAGVSAKTHVVFGLDPEIFKVEDTGTSRTGGDTFIVAGVKDGALVAKAVRWLWIFNTPSTDRSVTVANDELIDYYQQRVNRDFLLDCIAQAKLVSRVIPTGTLAAMLYLMGKSDREMLKIFAHDLEKGERGAGVLLKRIGDLKTNSGGRLKETYITALTFIAWNAYRTKNAKVTARMLRWTELEAHPMIE